MDLDLAALVDAPVVRRFVPVRQAATLLGTTAVQVELLVSNGTLYRHPSTGGLCADMVLTAPTPPRRQDAPLPAPPEAMPVRTDDERQR